MRIKLHRTALPHITKGKGFGITASPAVKGYLASVGVAAVFELGMRTVAPKLFSAVVRRQAR